MSTPRQWQILVDIARERGRQSDMWQGPHSWGSGDCSSPDVAITTKVAVLLEEAGEAARAVLEHDPQQLRKELVQLAAVAVAIIEGIDT